MNGHIKTVDYAQQLEAFRKSDAERDALVSEVIENYEKLKVGSCKIDPCRMKILILL